MSRKSSPSKNLPHSGSPSEQPSLIRTGSSEEENAAEGLQPRMLRRRAPTTALAFRSIPLILTRDEPESSSPLVGAGPPPPPPLSNIIRPQVTRMRTILVTSSNSAFSPQLLSTSQIFSPSPSIRPASRTSQTFGGVTPANIILSSGSAIDQDDGDELVPLPQVSFLPFGYFPRGPRPVAAGEHPLYRYINMVVDLSRPDNGWVRDYHALLRLGVTLRENIGPDYMIESTIALGRVLNVLVNRLRVNQTFDRDFLDSLDIASEQLRQNAIAYYDATRRASQQRHQQREQQE